MIFDYRKLKGKIKEVYNTQEAFARAMDLSEASVSMKLNNKIEWSQQEINKAITLLGIDNTEIVIYFFALEV